MISTYFKKVEDFMEQANLHTDLNIAHLINPMYTDLHIHGTKVGLMSGSIAKKLSLSKNQIQLASILGTMHDIGKLKIPTTILYKEGNLTHKEWNIMKMHPIYSGEFVKLCDSPFNTLSIYSNVVRCHHEHWDGSGYPDGLSKEQIPLLSRIITIADIFDAITTPRIYRKDICRTPLLTMEKDIGTIIDPYLFKQVKPILENRITM